MTERVREEVGASGGPGGLAGLRCPAHAAAAGAHGLRARRLDATQSLEGLSAHLQPDTSALQAHLRQQSHRLDTLGSFFCSIIPYTWNFAWLLICGKDAIYDMCISSTMQLA